MRISAVVPRVLSLKTRAMEIERMSREEFDVVVIGGGITGAGIALDATARGLSVALVEKSDFASGTSSRSTKLIHGGLRYLEHFEFGLVREALRERATLTRLAPHLSKPLQFLIPVYESGIPSPLGRNRLKLRFGLWVYDLLAGRLNVGRHRWVTKEEALSLSPKLEARGLRGGFIYYDCLTNDARLVIEVIKEGAARGASVANYARVCGFTQENGRVSGVEVEDRLTGAKLDIRARTVVNATGVWSDDVLHLANPSGERRLRPSKGIHIIVPRAKIDTQAAVLIPSVGEDRFLFVIPWCGRTLIGTTDTDYSGELDEPIALEDEVARMLESANRAFPDSTVTESDVISTFAGLRPLVSAERGSTADVSRKELVYESSGMISIIGGKLTSYRSVAERTVDLIVKGLGRQESRKAILNAGMTDAIPLATSDQLGGDIEVTVVRKAQEFGLPRDVVEHLIDDYAGSFHIVLAITRECDEFKERLVKDLPHIAAEVAFSARYEMALSVEDFLARRTRIALLAADNGLSCSTLVADLLRRELGPENNENLTSDEASTLVQER